MGRMRKSRAILLFTFVGACSGTGGGSGRGPNDSVSPAELGLDFVTASEARTDVGNSSALNSKLELIDRATQSIDMAYFIYTADYSSSYLSQKLIAKAQSGVKVRILVDAMQA